jgi:hypothetical protein
MREGGHGGSFPIQAGGGADRKRQGDAEKKGLGDAETVRRTGQCVKRRFGMFRAGFRGFEGFSGSGTRCLSSKKVDVDLKERCL